MKKYLSSLLIILFSVNASALTFNDKDKHFIATTAISSATYMVANHYGLDRPKSAMVGFFTAIAIGAAKELLIDDKIDPKDMEANMFGAATGGILLPLVFQF